MDRPAMTLRRTLFSLASLLVAATFGMGLAGAIAAEGGTRLAEAPVVAAPH